MSFSRLSTAPIWKSSLWRLIPARQPCLSQSLFQSHYVLLFHLLLGSCFIDLCLQLPDDPEEGSHDEVGEEPPEDCLDNVKIVKVVNFNWHHTEVELVSFLLRKASSLQKLLLVFSKAAQLDMPGVHGADLLLIHEALTNGKIMLSESDDVATQPYHYEVFLEV